MSINKFNPEGYYDPTSYEALSNITREERAARAAFRPMVYICSPYSGDIEANTNKAKAFCRFALDNGQIPLAPHLFFPQFMNDSDPKERDLALFMDIILMGKCQELWVLGQRDAGPNSHNKVSCVNKFITCDANGRLIINGLNISKGMAMEIAKATKRRQPIRYFNDDFEEVGSL